MSIEKATGHCLTCGKRKAIERPGVNHVGHLIGTIFTCGLWSIVYGLAMMAQPFTKWRCIECGTKTKKSFFK